MYIILDKQDKEKIVLADDNLKRLQDTLLFKPEFSKADILEAADDELEKGYDGWWYLKGKAPVQPLEEKVEQLESSTGLNRMMRELVLAEDSGASDYIKNKAQEIEDLAEQLREQDDFGDKDEEILAPGEEEE